MDTDVFFLDVSCSDGLFCNGEEHFVDGASRAAPRAACDDDRNACTTDLCKESTGECFWTLDAARGAECTACTGAQCAPDCTGKTCGSDGCDGECGQCGANQACTDGACASVIGRRDTCSAPIALLPPTFTPALLSASKPYEFRVTGSTTDAVNLVAPSCNDASDARDQIFSFVVPAGAEWGLLASVTGTRVDGNQYDTVLDLRKGDCLCAAAIVVALVRKHFGHADCVHAQGGGDALVDESGCARSRPSAARAI